MDGVSGAFAVVSLAIQLGEGISKLCRLLRSINEAPSEVVSIIEDLSFLIEILEDIRRNENSFGSHNTTQRALERCMEPVHLLQAMVESFTERFRSKHVIRRKWAALDSVRKNDQISKLKAKVEEAKQSLTIALQCSTVRAAHQYYLSHQQTLEVMSQNFAASQNEGIIQSQPVVSSYQQGESQIMEAVRSEIPQTAGFWPVRSMQNRLIGELETAIKFSVSNVLQDYPHLPVDSPAFKIQGAKSRCIETSFTFLPSWLVAQFGLPSIKFDMMKIATGGLQMNIRTFNVIPDDSLIFKYCKEGNLNGVRYLLDNKKASLTDMTSQGMTPLHVAASHAQTELCSLLIQAGADRTARCLTSLQRTAFMCACSAQALVKDTPHFLAVEFIKVPPRRYTDTIQNLVRTGEDMVELNMIELLGSIINTEHSLGVERIVPQLPSLWILNDVLPQADFLDDAEKKSIWGQVLYRTLELRPGHSSLPKLVEHCSVIDCQSELLYWIQRFCYQGQDTQGYLQPFKLLADRCGGVNFINPFKQHESFLGYALEQSFMFSRIQNALKTFGYDMNEIIEKEIALVDNDWTKEGLSAMFAGVLWPMERNHAVKCNTCNYWCSFPYNCRGMVEVPWERRKQRAMAGIDFAAPLSEEELRLQTEYDERVKRCKEGTCVSCQQKEREDMLEESSPFLLAI